MNKTMKTIAWICLVLGLLGLAADAAVLVAGRTMVLRMREAVEECEYPLRRGRFGLFGKGDFDALKENCEDVDGDGDVDREDLKAWRSDFEGEFGNRGNMGGRGVFGNLANRGGFHGVAHKRFDPRVYRPHGFVIPLLLLASGPVLTVVGAVMLIVNREPKKKGTPLKKGKSKKS